MVARGSEITGRGDGWEVDYVYRACGKKAVKLESVDASGIVQAAMLHEYVRNLIRSMTTDIARGDVRFRELCFEERPEEEENCGVIVYTAQISPVPGDALGE